MQGIQGLKPVREMGVPSSKMRFQGFSLNRSKSWEEGVPGMGWWDRWTLKRMKASMVRDIQKDPIINGMDRVLDKLGVDVHIAPYYDPMEGPASVDTFYLAADLKADAVSYPGWTAGSKTETVISSDPKRLLLAGFLLGLKRTGANIPFLKEIFPQDH